MKNATLYDVVVVGSGAAGLTSALVAASRGLKVVVLEKSEHFGGTTAVSGGWLWIPLNPQSVAAGIDDSEEAVHCYFQSTAGSHYDKTMVDAFLKAGPAMVRFVEQHTGLRFDLGKEFPDYHPTLPGGRAGGRSIVPQAIRGQTVGPWLKDLAPPLRELTFLGMVISGGSEVKKFLNVTRSVDSFLFVMRRLFLHAFDVVRYGRGMRLVNGNALVGGLARALQDRGVELRLSTALDSLLVEEGAVRGVEATHHGASETILARKGVVLATGGFPHDRLRRKSLFPHPPSAERHWSLAAKGNTGDGLRAAENIGASIRALPNAAPWAPVSRVPRRDGTEGLYPHFVDRGKPGIIAVRRNGKRFVNESDSYHDFGQALLAASPNDEEAGAFFVCDHPTMRRYGLGVVRPHPVPFKQHLRSGYLVRAQTLQELAVELGIDKTEFVKTVSEFNQNAVLGKDPEFHRGDNVYNRFQGDTSRTDHSLAPLTHAPFYGVRILAGSLGTYSGLATDPCARVLDAQGTPISGLYAVGNDMASITGGDYPAGGSTLGPGMAFGYIAGTHVSERDTPETSPKE